MANFRPLQLQKYLILSFQKSNNYNFGQVNEAKNSSLREFHASKIVKYSKENKSQPLPIMRGRKFEFFDFQASKVAKKKEKRFLLLLLES